MIRKLLLKLLGKCIPEMTLIFAQQTLFNELERSCRDFEVRLTGAHQEFVVGARKEIAEGKITQEHNDNLRQEVIDLQIRVDALCQVCGVEVVVTDGEAFTAEISQPLVTRSQEAAAKWMIAEGVINAKEAMLKTLNRIQYAESILKSQRNKP